MNETKKQSDTAKKVDVSFHMVLSMIAALVIISVFVRNQNKTILVATIISFVLSISTIAVLYYSSKIIESDTNE